MLAPNAPWRRAVVARPAEAGGAPLVDGDGCGPLAPMATAPAAPQVARARPAYRAWADLMRRAFESDVLACPRCGGRMVVLATIEDPAVIRRILTHLGLSLAPGEAVPSRAPPADDGSMLER